MSGRNPLTPRVRRLTSIASLQGNPIADPPDWLAGAGRDEWVRVVRELEESSVLTTADYLMLAAYCDTFSKWKGVTLRLETEGYMLEGSRGQSVLNPLARYALGLLAEMRRIASEFGFTPTSRGRVRVPPPDGEGGDDWAEFQKGEI